MILQWLVYLLRLPSTCRGVIGFSPKVINIYGIISSSIITWVQPVSNRTYVLIKKKILFLLYTIFEVFLFLLIYYMFL